MNKHMIDVYSWPTPNGHKVHIMLEECGYRLGKDWLAHPIHIGQGDQFTPEFLTSGDKAMEIFGNEIRALLSLDHPHIVKVYDYGVTGRIILFEPLSQTLQILEENLWFLSMEYVSQCTLADLIRENGGALAEENAGKFFI